MVFMLVQVQPLKFFVSNLNPNHAEIISSATVEILLQTNNLGKLLSQKAADL